MAAPADITVLLDMDGTLIDSHDAVVRCIHMTMEEMGHPADRTEDLGWTIGPPLTDTMALLLGRHGDDRVAEGVAVFQRHHDELVLAESPLFPGIREVLDRFGAEGRRLVLTTSKALPAARMILERHGLMGLFAGTYGANADDTGGEKPEVIARAIAGEGIDPTRAIMVGDRRYDISGAHANKVRALGVLWGYGGREELESAGADGLVDEPGDLAEAIDAMARRL
ncbi:HAD family hydrolase [Tistrella mobilis]|uniref:HAD family hydrolase n=1 Tax=Tistrella mobilis TaxID=171437 RepID=UPI003555C8A8